MVKSIGMGRKVGVIMYKTPFCNLQKGVLYMIKWGIEKL